MLGSRVIEKLLGEIDPFSNRVEDYRNSLGIDPYDALCFFQNFFVWISQYEEEIKKPLDYLPVYNFYLLTWDDDNDPMPVSDEDYLRHKELYREPFTGVY